MGRSLRLSIVVAWGAWSLGVGCILSPQPDPPGANVMVSAADGLGDVAVVGGRDSVPAGAPVCASRSNGDGAFGGCEDCDAGDDGSFAVVIPAGPGDVLRVTYFVWEDGLWRESLPREIVVDAYDPSLPLSADVNDPGVSPIAPGERDDGMGGWLGTLAVEAPVSGRARVFCAGGCTQPGVQIVVANQESGFVLETAYDGGTFDVRVPASVGDVLLVFAVRPDNPSQSSRVLRLVVPAP